MDKPISLSMREYIVRTMAVKLMLPEKIIDAVVVHQFSEANKALLDNHSVEISGFGKFLFNHKKAAKKLAKLMMFKEHFEKLLATDSLSEQKRATTMKKLESVTEAINILKPKVDETQLLTNSGGMEKQVNSPCPHEESDRADKQV